jgi:4-amino-4-deoxy-L-arabinose transferase-like glycosyltransferase
MAAAAGLLLALDIALIATTGFDGLYGQDAFAFHDRAVELAGALRGGGLTPFLFPSGYPALVALVAELGPSPVVAGQAVSVVAAVAVVLLSGAAAREVGAAAGFRDRVAAVIGATAALITAMSAQLWQWSVTVMSDTTALAWAALAGWATVRYVRRRSAGWVVLAGAATVLAASTRYEYAVLVVPFGVAAAWALRRDPPPAPGSGIRHGLAAVATMVVVVLPTLLVIMSAPDTVLDHGWLRGWSPLNAFRSRFATPSGMAEYPLPVAAATIRAALSPALLFPLLAPAALLGAWRLLGPAGQDGRRRASGAAVVGWGVALFLLYAGIPFHNPRWALSFLPPLAVLTAVGLATVAEHLSVRQRRMLVGGVAACLLVGLTVESADVRAFVARKDADLTAARWVEATVPADAHVVAFELTATVDHYTDLTVEELYLLEDGDVTALATGREPAYLLLDVEDVEHRWRQLPPFRHLERLRADPGLEVVGAHGRWDLLRLRAATSTTADR